MKLLPTTINHNTIITASALSDAAKDNPKLQRMVDNIKEQATAEKFTSPIQVQAEAMSLHQHIGKDENGELKHGIKLMIEAAQHPTKLPVYNTAKMEEDGFPNEVIQSAKQVNHQFATGTDPATLKQMEELQHNQKVTQTASDLPQFQELQSNQEVSAEPIDVTGLISG